MLSSLCIGLSDPRKPRLCCSSAAGIDGAMGTRACIADDTLLWRRLATVVIRYLYFLAANGVVHLLGPLGFFFSNRYLLNHPRGFLHHWHLFGLAHLNRALLKGMSRDRCFDRTPALDCDALTVQRHVPFHRPFHDVASYPCGTAIDCALADLEVFLGQRDHFFGPGRGLRLSSNPGTLRR